MNQEKGPNLSNLFKEVTEVLEQSGIKGLLEKQGLSLKDIQVLSSKENPFVDFMKPFQEQTQSAFSKEDTDTFEDLVFKQKLSDALKGAGTQNPLERQKQELLQLPIEVLEIQAKLWADLLKEKQEMNTPERQLEKLKTELAELDAEILAVNKDIPNLLIKDTAFANAAYAHLADLVNRKMQVEKEIKALTK